MRVIAGEYRGRVLYAPKGMDTRPTIDRVRESLMSSITSYVGNIEGVRAFDVFAGSGALGIELLSRGAEYVLFCDSNKEAVLTVRHNLESLKVEQVRYDVVLCNVLQRLPKLTSPFDVVLLDPPYAYEASVVCALLEALECAGALAQDVLITYEHAKGSDVSALFCSSTLSLEGIKTKTYGEVAIDFIQRKV